MISDDSHGIQKCRGRKISKSLSKSLILFVSYQSKLEQQTNECAKLQHFGLQKGHCNY